jgi:hypothetical protein
MASSLASFNCRHSSSDENLVKLKLIEHRAASAGQAELPGSIADGGPLSPAAPDFARILCGTCSMVAGSSNPTGVTPSKVRNWQLAL